MSKPVKNLIRAWMAKNELTSESIAIQMGRPNGASGIRRFYSGAMTSKPIQQWFLDAGCPPEALGLAVQGGDR
jgi:hypothetical protein